MPDEQLPQIPSSGGLAEFLAGIPEYLVPRSIKAIDRLIGAAVDIPVAWLNQQKAKIDSQTSAYAKVDAAISKAAGEQAATDPEIIEKAIQGLVRKAYRKQKNVESISRQALQDLSENSNVSGEQNDSNDVEVDADWLNLFERYAEDASSERMQNLWGRILAGEIRRPGRFSLRTLRYISEISQKEANLFAKYSRFFVERFAPKSLIVSPDKKDISDLLLLEENGLIQGASGPGLSITRTVPPHGFIIFVDKNTAIGLKAEPGQELRFDVVILTDLGLQLLDLITDRDEVGCLTQIASGFRSENTTAAYIFPRQGDNVNLTPLQVLWLTDAEEPG